MSNSWDRDIVASFEALGGSASYEDLYAHIAAIRASLPPSWKEVVRRRIQDLSSDSAGWKHGPDLFYSVKGLGAGVWGLRSKLAATPKAVDLPPEPKELSSGNQSPEKAPILTYRVLRDTPLARQIKVLHQNRCQICGESVQLSDGKMYSEAHHIVPLGAPHHGPDQPGNIIVLCPNHHVLCDYGAIALSSTAIRSVGGHQISAESINYHNTKIFGHVAKGLGGQW
jgi:hypothetical protein